MTTLELPERMNAAAVFVDVHMKEGRGAKPAILCGDRTITYADLYEGVNRFGNAMTGLRARLLSGDVRLQAGGNTVVRARTFPDLPPGEPFWYENSSGLAEIAVNQGRADTALGLAVGTPVVVHKA